MALKITVPIGTDRGITSEAYVRITDYNISKSGNASFRLQIFQSQEDAKLGSSAMTPTFKESLASRNSQIGEVVNVSLMVDKQVMVPSVRSSIVEVPVEKEVPDTKDEQGNILTLKTITVMETQVQTETVEELTTIKVADISTLEGVNIFEYAYNSLREKLVQLFGAENIVDC
jgi:hypothetical protein